VTAARRTWSPAEVLELARQEVAVSVEIAASVIGIPRSTAYAAIKAGAFPAPVIQVSARRWVVPTAHLVKLLGLDRTAEGVGPRRDP
jgi:predicted DNA-binding transcriptional regulator AlpA